MKRFLMLLLFSGLARSQEPAIDYEPVRMELLTDLPLYDVPHEHSRTVHLCNPPTTDTPDCRYRLDKLEYLKKEKEVIESRLRDFDETGDDHIDLDLRRRIRILDMELAKSPLE